jgi:serine/threonine protein kinase/tetratricopeptide (TPR) repeat protein
MDPERWRRVEELFHRALGLASAERAALLEAECGGDGDLRARVERLLEADERPHALVDRFESGALLPAGDPLLGREVGPYRLSALIGVGGMGVVYRAQRVDGLFEREVAVKLIRIELAGPTLVRRFEAERRALAALNHPNIAQLLDGGATPEGRPYLVMELVLGTPIDRYCDEHRLSVEERLRLFVRVCRAVHYAHQNLVVHRDLKPGNILVDAQGEPKLLDFGIARLLAESSPRTDSLTLTGAPVLTPDYASPEQLLLGPVTTAMDVYSLGVVAYELLAGRRPFQSENLPPIDWQRAVIERAPKRPSTTAIEPRAAPAAGAASTVSAEEVATRRSATPRSLERRLRGDLDRIVLMALRKEPERRYGSAKELADDVEAHLAGLPVRARPDSMVYRTTKFVRRNRLAVALCVAVFASLLVGLLAARRAEQRARAQAVHARIEADSFQRISEFLLDDFLSSTDASSDAARERLGVLDQAARVRREHASEDHLRANLLDSLGRVAQRLGSFDDAEALIREALGIRERAFGPTSLEVALSLRSLGLLLRERGNVVDAADLLARALALHRERADETHTDVAATANDLASVQRELGQLDAAEGLVREVLALRRAAGPPSLSAAETLELSAAIARDRGDLAAAQSLGEEALAMRRAIVGDEHALTVRSLCDLAALRAASGASDAAQPMFEEAERNARALQFAGRELLARVLLARAAADIDAGRALQARERIEAALALEIARVGSNHPSVAAASALEALVLQAEGRTEEARERWSRALAIRRLPGTSPWLLGQTLFAAGQFSSSIGAQDDARKALSEAVVLLSAPGVARTPVLASAQLAYADILLDVGDPAAARPQLEAALTFFSSASGVGRGEELARAESLRKRCETAGAR